jgi:outer membrane receptor protein involved in Fe transport
MSKQEKAAPAATTGINYTTTISAAVAAAVGGAVPVYAQDDVSGIEEITVTATKRGDVSIQDLAGSIQAFGTEQIRDQNLFNMEDYAKFTPSMVYFGNQAGSGQVYFRGIADAPDTFIAASSAAVYLDEQPVTQSSQVDVRLVDIERVEALSGPQGTLFGSSSQSGTLRIVTNKPDPTAFYANVDLSAKGMEGGDPSYDVSGVLNLPLVPARSSIRTPLKKTGMKQGPSVVVSRPNGS